MQVLLNCLFGHFPDQSTRLFLSKLRLSTPSESHLLSVEIAETRLCGFPHTQRDHAVTRETQLGTVTEESDTVTLAPDSELFITSE